MRVKLGEIYTLQMGKTPARKTPEYWNNGDNDWVSIADLSTYHKYVGKTKETISDVAVKESGIKTVPANTVIMSFKLSIGKTAITVKPTYTNEAIMAFIPTGKYQILPEYAYYLFSGKNWAEGSNKAVMGITLNKATLQNVEITVPSLEFQRSVIEKLDKISNVIALREAQLTTLDELVKSRFVEMFGDPQTNPKDWNIVTIGDVISRSEAGWSGNGRQREKKPGEIAVLKVSAVTKGYFIPEECKVLDDQKNIKKYVFPQKGDLLFSRANTREMVGATAIIDKDYPEYILPDKLWKIRFTADSNVYYMKYILSSKPIRERFSAESTGTSGSMYNVSMEKFRSIPIPLPPMELQTQFAAFVQATDQTKSTIQASLDELETLKKSLMQDYFG